MCLHFVDIAFIYKFHLLNYLLTYYPAIRSIGRDTKFTVYFFVLCTVTDFSAGALPIGVKFYRVFRREILDGVSARSQVFSHFGGIAPAMAEF